MAGLDQLATEQASPGTADLDLLPLDAALLRLNDEDQEVPRAVRAEIPQIARAVELAVLALRTGGRLIYVGAGTSGRLGCLDAAEIPPTYGLEPGRVLGILAGGDRALRNSVEGAEDDLKGGEAALLAAGLTVRDVVCGIAASGRTPFVLGALALARRTGCPTVGLTTNRPSEMEGRVDVLIAPQVGPEPVSGSTRMKSGTAQKLVLNMLSTMSMVRLGKTYGNLMVDVRATNEKLVRRAHRLIHAVTGAAEPECARLFQESNGDTKVAILMGLAGLDLDSARERLEAAGGLLRAALRDGTPPA